MESASSIIPLVLAVNLLRFALFTNTEKLRIVAHCASLATISTH